MYRICVKFDYDINKREKPAWNQDGLLILTAEAQRKGRNIPLRSLRLRGDTFI